MVAAATLPGVFQTGTHAARPAATAVAAGALYACTTHTGYIYQSDGSSWSNYIVMPTATGIVSALPIIVGDGLSVVSAGRKGAIEIPFAGTITANRIFADASGSIVFDLKKATYSGLPTLASICASAKPTLSAAQKSVDTTLSGWTTAVAAGDWLEVWVEATPTTIKNATLSLTITRA